MTNLIDEIDDPEIEKIISTISDWKALSNRHFIRRVEQGRLGWNLGLDNGLVAINNYIFGTQKSMFYLIGADSGIGKTTIADFMFVLNAFEQCRREKRKLYFYYYSFEISKYKKQLKWVSYYIMLKFGIMLPTHYIDGKVKDVPVTDEHMKMIRVAYAYVELIMESITFIEDPIHPTAIYFQLLAHYESIGVVHRAKPLSTDKPGRIIGFTPKPAEEQSITMAMLDHGALLMPEQSFDTKRTMDLMSKYVVTLRNLFDLTFVYVQQFNSELTTSNRDNFKKTTEFTIMPQRVDFGDSTYTFRDADVVLGLISPARFDLPTFFGYNIKQFGHMFLAMVLMKNRYGPSGRVLPLFMNPVAGIPRDLPTDAQAPMANFITELKQIEQCQLHYQQKL